MWIFGSKEFMISRWSVSLKGYFIALVKSCSEYESAHENLIRRLLFDSTKGGLPETKESSDHACIIHEKHPRYAKSNKKQNEPKRSDHNNSSTVYQMRLPPFISHSRAILCRAHNGVDSLRLIAVCGENGIFGRSRGPSNPFLSVNICKSLASNLIDIHVSRGHNG